MDEPRPDQPLPRQPLTIPDRDILRRHRVVQVISVLMIVAGILLPVIALVSIPDLLTANPTPESVQRYLGPILLLGLGGLSFVVGLVMNAARSLIVRAALPPERYRGPAIFVLLMLALIVGAIVSVVAAGTLLAVRNGGELTAGGTLLLLTATQIGLLAVTGGLVVLPGTLAGFRLIPPSGLWRSLAIGLALAIPAWVGVTLLTNLAASALEGMGFHRDKIVETVMSRGDPTVIVLAVVLVAPIAEELFFRGLVYNAWEREHGARVAVLGSAGLFAAIHADPFALLPIFVLGVGLALVYRSTRSLPATIVLHAAFNAITVTIVLLERLGIPLLPT